MVELGLHQRLGRGDFSTLEGHFWRNSRFQTVIFTHLRRHRLRTTYLSTVQQVIANRVAWAKKIRWVDLASGNFHRPSLRMALPIVLRSNFSKFWKILSEEGGISRDIRLNKSPGLSRKVLHRRIQYRGGPHGELCQDRWRKPSSDCVG